MSSETIVTSTATGPAATTKKSHQPPATTKTATYSRWRPSYHLIAPRGWINDPCAPGYIPSTGRYHVGFQWNPKGAEWGDVVWGKAFSADLVAWDVSETPSLERDAPYDHAGVFTGCWRPTGVDGAEKKGEEGTKEGAVSFIYTSVSRLPIHYTKAYHRGCETLSLATSQDGGQTWVKDARNPVLPGPPEGVDALGWRDPYVAEWPAVAKLLSSSTTTKSSQNGGGDEKKPLLGLISGGIRDKTPTTWLYKVDAADLSQWEFVGPLVKPGLNFAPSRWTGDIGVNWEVTNFVSLTNEDGTTTQDFLIFGAEGCKPLHGGAGVVPGTKRTNRAQLWIAIDPTGEAAVTTTTTTTIITTRQGVSSPEQKPLMKFSYGGIFDHGLYYAANGFWDPVTQQQVVVGWVTEEDIPVASQVKQGWSGCLSLPRVASLVTIPHVVRASTSASLHDITSIRVTKEEDNNTIFTVQTLGVKPDARLQKLRAGAAEQKATALGAALPLKTAQWEASAQFAQVGSSQCERVGVKIRHACTSQQTVLYFAQGEEAFVIQRPDIYFEDAEAAAKEGWSAQLQDETAPFTLFTSRDGQQHMGQEKEESLRVHVFYDGSVLEVFVNERVAITTRVYLEDQKCAGLEFFAEGGGPDGGCVLEEATVWDGLSA